MYGTVPKGRLSLIDCLAMYPRIRCPPMPVKSAQTGENRNIRHLRPVSVGQALQVPPVAEIPSQPGETRGRVAEAVQLDAHSVHDREIEAAELAALVTTVGVVQNAAGLKRTSQAAD